MRKALTTLIREPFFCFLAMGIVVYFLYGFIDKQLEGTSVDTLTITAAEVNSLEQAWAKRWNRLPTAQERQGLLDAHVREQLMYRQALALGLDRGDSIIRRQLAQKLNFLTRDLTEIPSPSKEELRTYFQAHLDRYQNPVRLSFTHVYFSPDIRGEQAVEAARKALARLAGNDAPEHSIKELSDPFGLQHYYPDRIGPEVAQLFGNAFAQKTFQLPVGQWAGPIASEYGLHVVYVHDRIESAVPEWDDIENQVLQDWVENKRKEVNENFYAGLRSRYTVIVEPEDVDTTVAGSEARP